MSDSAWVLATSAIGIAINGFGLVFVATQVALARRQIRIGVDQSQKEDLRLRRQSTIDFYMATLDRVSQWRAALPDDWDKTSIHAYTDKAYKRGGEGARKLLASYLGYLEGLAVAIRSGIYDMETLNSIAGSRIINVSDNYQAFFDRRREEAGTNHAYENIEWLAAQLRELRGQTDA